jgi:hypothetical protein
MGDFGGVIALNLKRFRGIAGAVFDRLRVLYLSYEKSRSNLCKVLD